MKEVYLDYNASGPVEMTEAAPAASSPDLAPWGSPPTPLLPKWHLDTLADVALPSELLELIVSPTCETQQQTIGDLDDFWQRRSQPISVRATSMLADLVSKHRWPPREHVILPDAALLTRFLRCPLSTRPLNCIRRGMHKAGPEQDLPVTVGWFLSLPNFGIVSLLEVMCIAEAAAIGDFLATAQSAGNSLSKSMPGYDHAEASTLAWDSVIPLLRKLLSASAGVHDAHTVADALMCDLGQLMLDMQISDDLDDILISDLAPSPTLAEEALTVLSAFWESLAATQRHVCRERIIAAEPKSFSSIGREIGLTHEAIRRSHMRLEKRLQALADADNAFGCWLRVAAATITRHAGSIISASRLEERIAAAFPAETDISHGDSQCSEETNAGESNRHIDRTAVLLARQLLRTKLGYTRDGRFCLDRKAAELVRMLKSAALHIADDEGLIDESELRDHVPDETWQQHWSTLIRLCGLHHSHGWLALQDTARAQVKAALLSIGRPATKTELAEATGFAPKSISSHLSAIESVVRADKKRWGLKEWVDDVYKGIPAEIVQRIEEDGGATRLERLLDELPRMFGVSKRSVISYVGAPKFSLADGLVSIADPSSIVLRPLDTVVHGHTADGRPYWRFKIEERHFDGYSLAGIPPEIPDALGCKPDGRIRVPVSEPAGCAPISLSWRLASNVGNIVGFLSEPLRRLGTRTGEHARLVINSPESVSVQVETGNNNADATSKSDTLVHGDTASDAMHEHRHTQRQDSLFPIDS